MRKTRKIDLEIALRGALYLYASEGAAPVGFNTAMFDAAWKRET